jgi:hypothetical protein
VDEFADANVVILQAFRLVVGDLISLYHVLNESVLKLLATYFELEKSSAKLALEVYKDFAEQSKKITAFFSLATRMQAELGIQVPQFKHVILIH